MTADCQSKARRCSHIVCIYVFEFLINIVCDSVSQVGGGPNCCISQCAKYRKSGIFGFPWEQNPSTDRHETWGA